MLALKSTQITHGATQLNTLLDASVQALFSGSVALDPPAIAPSSHYTYDIVTAQAFTQANFVLASFSNLNANVTLTACVTAAGTVTVKFQNHSGSSVNLGSGTLRYLILG